MSWCTITCCILPTIKKKRLDETVCVCCKALCASYSYCSLYCRLHHICFPIVLGQHRKVQYRARIFKLLSSPRIDSKEPIPPGCVAWAPVCQRLSSPGMDSEESIPQAFVAWWPSSTNRVVVPARQAGNRFLGSSKGLQIRALCRYDNHIFYSVPSPHRLF
jgi:hypothetical protein